MSYSGKYFVANILLQNLQISYNIDNGVKDSKNLGAMLLSKTKNHLLLFVIDRIKISSISQNII
jgi:hypothetical protein